MGSSPAMPTMSAGIRTIRTKGEFLVRRVLVKLAVLFDLSDSAFVVDIGRARVFSDFISKFVFDLHGKAVLEVAHGGVAAAVVAVEVCGEGFGHCVVLDGVISLG